MKCFFLTEVRLMVLAYIYMCVFHLIPSPAVSSLYSDRWNRSPLMNMVQYFLLLLLIWSEPTTKWLLTWSAAPFRVAHLLARSLLLNLSPLSTVSPCHTVCHFLTLTVAVSISTSQHLWSFSLWCDRLIFLICLPANLFWTFSSMKHPAVKESVPSKFPISFICMQKLW